MMDGKTVKSLYVEFVEEGGLIRTDTIVEEIEGVAGINIA
jgi:hypothetical protein